QPGFEIASRDPLSGLIGAGKETLRQPAAIEVAYKAAATRERLLPHHLGQPRDRLGAPRRPSGPEAGKQQERVGDQRSARRRWRVGNERARAERGSNRLARDDPICSKVLLGQAAALFANVRADAAADVTGVARPRPAFCSPLERCSATRHPEPAARDQRTLARAK